MANRHEGWLGHIGLNLIRLILGSYGLAMGLGYVSGPDYETLFGQFQAEWAAPLASFYLIGLSALFISGLWLRASALLLVGFIFYTSLIEMLMAPTSEAITIFWQRLTWIAGILMSYAPLRRYEMRQARIWPLGVLGANQLLRSKPVTPRRVTLSKAANTAAKPRASQKSRSLRPLIAPTDQMAGTNRPTRPPLPYARNTQPNDMPIDHLDADEDEFKNLFANL